MKKLLYSLLLFLFSSTFSYAQRWDSLGGGLTSHIVSYPLVQALGVYNGKLYAGGAINVGSSNCIATWNGNSWSTVGNGLIGNYIHGTIGCGSVPNVAVIESYNGNLFAGGYFDSITGLYANAVAQWNEFSWDSVADGVEGASNRIALNCADVTSFAVYNSDLYMGGIFQYTGNNLRVNHITKWDGSAWSAVGSGMSVNGSVNCLAIYNGNLYAAGNFDTAGGIPVKNIAMWNGTQWSAVGEGINGFVNALTVYNGSLYAGGEFDSAGGHKSNSIAFWNGTTWSAVGSGILPLRNSGVSALTVYGSLLCVGGQFDTAGGNIVNNIAYWNGSTWGALGSGINGDVYALTTYNGALIVGGAFDSAGGVPANNIAEWLSPLGLTTLPDKNRDIQIYPNPGNGQFTIKSTVVSGQSIVNIYNVLGEKVFTETLRFPQGDNTIDISNQPAGVYLYRLLSEDGSLIGEGKVVIEK